MATAAHCIHPEYLGVKYRSQPGYDGSEILEGSFAERYYRVDYDKEGEEGCRKYDDIGIRILEDGLGDRLGWLGIGRYNPDMEFNKEMFFSFGYPGDLHEGQRPVRQEGIKVVKKSPCGGDAPLWTNADAAGSMSGGRCGLMKQIKLRGVINMGF